MRRPAVTACPATLRSAVGATGFWTLAPRCVQPQPAPTPSPDLHRGVPTRVPATLSSQSAWEEWEANLRPMLG